MNNRIQVPITVRYGEVDAMKVAYHAHYFQWFQCARDAFFKAMGCSVRSLEAAGYQCPIIEVGCSYYAPATYADELVVSATLSQTELAANKFRFTFELANQKFGTRLASGFTVSVLVTPNKALCISLPAPLRAALDRMVWG